ncbi:unnamed protein product [Xylocopa violacea]|uniref:Uncharacterized protein n=1 Tax=Xylocopa violacea TaxID=135666 RepID=A0ABP1N7Q9_XYLVO
MLLFKLERCAFYTQIRQLAALHIHGKVQINKKSMYHFTEYKYSNLSNPNLCVQRLCSTNPGNQQKESLKPFIWQHREIDFAIYNVLFSYIKIITCVDATFGLMEFLKEAYQALLVISQALAAQNYEALEGLVNGRTIKLIKLTV